MIEIPQFAASLHGYNRPPVNVQEIIDQLVSAMSPIAEAFKTAWQTISNAFNECIVKPLVRIFRSPRMRAVLRVTPHKARKRTRSVKRARIAQMKMASAIV